MPNARARRTDGFSRRDYALRNAAKLAGADLLDVCGHNERWMYSPIYDERSQQSRPPEIPNDIPNVIVVGQFMDQELTCTVPSALSRSATGLGYSYDALMLLTLAQYICKLGYRAYASMNDSSLAIPFAVQAGLGEVGRHSLLITKEFGPRLRLERIFTDMPLNHDTPQQFGVQEFCEICDRCASTCPPKAIPFDPPSPKTYKRSNPIGVSKWSVDAEKCFKFWANQNADCSICIRTCPFNRDFSRWYNRAWRKLAASRFRRLALWLDDRYHNWGRNKSGWWWGRNNETVCSTPYFFFTVLGSAF